MFLPILFSATHSYPPVSSCWKLGISSTALEYFILTLLGNGTPLALLQVSSGTGLQEMEEANLKLVAQAACVGRDPATKKCLMKSKNLLSAFFIFFLDE